jgi:hypothetical protein
MMKGGVSNSQASSRAAGVSIQTSLYGTAVSYLAGRSKITPKLVWLGSLVAVKQDGGKKSGKYSGSDVYRYHAACNFLTGHYPMRTPMSLFINKDVYTVAVISETLVVSGGSVTLAVNPGYFLGVVGCTVNVNLTGSFNDYGGDGSLSYNLTQGKPLWNQHYQTADGSAGSSKAPYTYDWVPADGRTIYFANGTGALNGKTVTVYYAYYPWPVMPLPWVNLQFETYLGQAAGIGSYNWVSGLYSPSFDLGMSNLFPSIAMECIGSLALFPSGDCDPADIITDLCTSGIRTAIESPHAGETILITHGLNLTDTQVAGAPMAIGSLLGDTSAMSAYCLANDIRASVYMDSQKAARDVLQELFDVANTAPVLSGDKLKCIPRSEVTAVGNGTLYTPPTASGPVCDLDDTCFKGEAPFVRPVRNRQADADNAQPIEYLSRQGAYETRVTTEIEQRSVHQFNSRKAQVLQMHSIHDDVVAEKVASIQVKRSAMLRNAHAFSVGVEFGFLEAMDLVRIADYRIFGVTQWRPVRLTSAKESWDDTKGWEIACEAEPFIYGLNAPTPMETQPSNPFTTPGTDAAGDVNAPLFMELPDSINEGSNLWIAISGATAAWGGCIIWASEDGVDYKQVGSVLGECNMGTLTATLANHVDPDTTNTLSVDLTESFGTLASVTDADRDSFRSLCWVNGELVSFKTATMTAAHKYDITSLRRALYGTVAASHASGSDFARLDKNIARVSLPAEWIGLTLSFKFTSFNTLGGQAQTLADVSPYTYTFLGHYGNFLQFVANDGTVDSLGTGGPPFTAATVRGYGKVAGVATPGTDITAYRSDGLVVTIPHATLTGQALSTFFYLMWNPKSNTDYLLTSYVDMTKALRNGHICIGPVKTVDAGGAGGSTGGGGGTGGGGCPCTDMWINPQLAVAEIRRLFHCVETLSDADIVKGAAPLYRTAGYVKVKPNVQCFELEAEDGAIYRGSWDTPFTQPDGSSVILREMGEGSVLTDAGEHTDRTWSKVKKLSDLGLREVVQVSFGGMTFPCGQTGVRRVWSHNMAKPEPIDI